MTCRALKRIVMPSAGEDRRVHHRQRRADLGAGQADRGEGRPGPAQLGSLISLISMISGRGRETPRKWGALASSHHRARLGCSRRSWRRERPRGRRPSRSKARSSASRASAIFSAIITVVKMRVGAHHGGPSPRRRSTRRPVTPITRRSGSTTERGSSPRRPCGRCRWHVLERPDHARRTSSCRARRR